MALITADDLLRNWSRYVWSGETVGNMEHYVPWEDNHEPIMIDHARKVDEMHQALPWHERMVILAEYPQKRNRIFKDLNARQRMERARRWIEDATGVRLTEYEYSMYLGFFKNQVGRRLL